MLLVALEKKLRLRAGLGYIHAIDGSRPAGGDVQAARRVEGHLPDVMRFRFGFFCAFLRSRPAIISRRVVELGRVEDDRRAAVVLLGGGVGLELVDLAAGQRGCVKRAIRAEAHDLHRQILALEECEGLAVQCDAQHG